LDRADELYAALERMKLLPGAERPALVPLPGGVSSDICRVDLSTRPICIKRALPKLKVAADWQAPVERNAYEADWMRIAATVGPDAVPRLLGEDRASGVFAMVYLEPERYPVWKQQLREGRIEVRVAAEVGRRIAAIHAATADRPDIAERFPTDRIFHAIRLDPYLGAAAARHPECAGPLQDLIETTARTRRALVHGDVSPKNILVGPQGPVFLDAECAWYGDPAFDLAFCLNHMLLKCLWCPQWRESYLACFDALACGYLAGVTWEPREVLEARAVRLLPGLFLSRVDGKSPVEYLTGARDKERVRKVAKHLLASSCLQLANVRDAWKLELAR
jgi:aminoglycoside phosphotransferase (APT) family kinase protein